LGKRPPREEHARGEFLLGPTPHSSQSMSRDGAGILGRPTADDLPVEEVEGAAAPTDDLGQGQDRAVVGDDQRRRSFDLLGMSLGGGAALNCWERPRPAAVRDELEGAASEGTMSSGGTCRLGGVSGRGGRLGRREEGHGRGRMGHNGRRRG
jgi:hypothetical protein